MTLALTFTAQAQETAITEYRNNKVKAVRNSGGKSISYYDKTGRITMTIQPVNSLQADTTFYYYDQRGNNIKTVNRHFIRPESMNVQREFIDDYFYDNLNRLIEKIRYTNQIIDDKELYFYNSCSSLDSVQTFYNYNSLMDDGSQDSMIFSGTKHYFYNAEGQLIIKKYERSTWEYEYDNAGQLVREISSSMYRPCRGEAFLLTQIAKYSYKAGKLIAIDYEYSTADNQIIPKHQTKYEYLSNGLRSKEIRTSWILSNNKEQQIDQAITEFYYDHN